MGAKGGRNSTIARKLALRRFCAPKCPLYTHCWAKHGTLQRARKEREDARKNGMDPKDVRKIKPHCAMNKLPTQSQDRFLRLAEMGQEGFKMELIEQLIRYGDDMMLDKRPAAKEKYIYQLRKVYKTLFGSKHNIEGEGGGLTAFTLIVNQPANAEGNIGFEKKIVVDATDTEEVSEETD